MAEHEMSELVVQGSTAQIYTLIPKLMEEVGAVSKDRKNEQQGYKFRGIEDFYQAVHPAMVKLGVFCAPRVMHADVTEREGLNAKGERKVSYRSVLKIRHRFYAPDGSFVDVVTVGEGIDTSDKASNKAMSAAMKYALIELLCVPTQDVEDADRTSPEMPPKSVSAPRTTAPVSLPKPPAAPKASGGPGLSVLDAQRFHIRFRDEWTAAGGEAATSEQALDAWLEVNKLVVDGKPSTKAIPVADLKQWAAKAKSYIAETLAMAAREDEQ